jgi:hypothetical protein
MVKKKADMGRERWPVVQKAGPVQVKVKKRGRDG